MHSSDLVATGGTTTWASRLRRVSDVLGNADRTVKIEVLGGGGGDAAGSEGSEITHANAMLLALCSDFFEAALRDEWSGRHQEGEGDGTIRIRLKEVSTEDVRALVEHSEGRGVGWEPPSAFDWHDDISRLLRIQGRFAMPQLREACAATLRVWSTDSSSCWIDACRAAADHGLWDVVADGIVRASFPPWRSLGELWSPGGIADELLMISVAAEDVAPETAVARILRHASFPYHGQRVALASRWWARSRRRHDGGDDANNTSKPVDDEVALALIEMSAICPLWLPEVGGIVLPHASNAASHAHAHASLSPNDDNVNDQQRALPSSVLAALVRCLVRTLSASCPPPIAEHRRGMAMIEASLVATAGTGVYQMALVPVGHNEKLDIDNAYVSDAVRMCASAASEPAVYHVYLEEAARLQAWWKLHGGAPGGIHNIFAFWAERR